MPAVEWNDENRKRMLLFLPAAGLLTGAAEVLWMVLFTVLGKAADTWLYAIIACLIPVFLNGGIHLDGLADSADALASWGSAEKKRNILKDPHIGTFGVLALIVYMMLCTVLLRIFFNRSAAEAGDDISLWGPAVLLGSLFVISRASVQIAIAWIPPAAKEGMLYQFSSLTDRRRLLLTGVILAFAGQILWFLAGGALTLLLLPCLAIHLFLFRRKMMRHFGGLSGDLCGRLLQLSELWMTALMCLITTV